MKASPTIFSDKEAIFVLHAFQKKSRRGVETPREDMEIIRRRLKVAALLAQELNNEKTCDR